METKFADRILQIFSRVTALLFKLGPLKNVCDGMIVFLAARALRIIGAPDEQELAFLAAAPFLLHIYHYI